jgi:hypothetical protein
MLAFWMRGRVRGQKKISLLHESVEEMKGNKCSQFFTHFSYFLEFMPAPLVHATTASQYTFWWEPFDFC